MARQSAPASKSKPKAKPSSAAKPKGRAASPAEKQAKKAGGGRAQAEDARLLDERTRRDITGVAFAVLAVVLFVAAVLPTNALVTSFISTALHLTLGLGAYLLPFLLLVVGASFLARFDRERVPLRVAVGLVMIFVAVLALLALFTPEGKPDGAGLLFDADQLAARGGYVGAGLAWVGLTLFGQVISCIIMFGVIVAGLVIIGFSLSKLVERVQDALDAARAEDGEDVLPAPRSRA
ncbi:MAG: DNA translocase FtsK 4TM domain-containing protein [Eggerthellaceae bacterium]